MSDFNRVFLVVKKHIEKQNRLAEISSLETIAKDADIPLYKLPVYLQDAGLIKYSMAEQYIYLTPFGKKQDALIKK